MKTPFSPLSFGKGFMKIRSAVPEKGSHIYALSWWTEKKTKKRCKTYTHPRPLAAADA